MKRVKKRNPRTKKTNQKDSFDIKQTLAFKLFIVCLIVLIFLIIIYIFIYKPSIVKEKELGGELGTLCIFCVDNPVELIVLNYTIFSDNVIYVNINWSAGNISSSDFNSIFVDFDMSVGANYNVTINPDLLGFGENKTYVITVISGSPINFFNVTNVLAYAEINVHLTQKSLIPDISFYKDDSVNNLIYLSNYFKALTDINYSVIESPDNNQIEIAVNNYTKNISISVLGINWFGTQRFNLTVISDLDSLTTFFNIIVINDTRPVINHEPEFNDDECGSFSWYKNTNKTIDMDSCWSDEDDDALNYNYSELNNYIGNISILELSGDRLKFVPKIGFNGSTYLTFYANDSHVRVSHRVNLYVLGNNTNANSPAPTPPLNPPTSVLELKSSSPAESKVSFFVNETKRFSIIAENYENIEWYVDNVLVKEGVLSYVFEEKRPGVYNIKARIINGTAIETKSWEVIVEEMPASGEKIFNVNVVHVIFYSIIIILIIIILLVIWMLIIEVKRRNRKKDFGFGISVVPNRNGTNESSKQFNIPKD